MKRLQASSPDVLDLTRRALEASLGKQPTLEIRCAACRARLAVAGYTPVGPLFTSSWPTPAPSMGPINGRRLTARQEAKIMFPGADVREDLATGVIAILQLPTGMAEDYPDLLVRCPRDGDAVLDRLDVLAKLRTGGEWKIDVSRPMHEYEEPDSDWLGIAEQT